MPVDVEKYVKDAIARSRAAQLQIEMCSQERADEMSKAVGKAVYDNIDVLAEEAQAETGMGNAAGKKRKAMFATAVTWDWMKDKKSTGVLNYDPETNVTTLAKPVGVVGAVCPSTNPIATPSFMAMICLKGRNSVVIAPHPSAKETGLHVAAVMRDALKAIGAPEDLVICLEECSLEASEVLMKNVDVITAVGGDFMVKAAYAAGKPCYGVGQGNVSVIMDEAYDDVDRMVDTMITGRTADNGVACTGEQILFVHSSRKDEVLSKFEEVGAYIVKDEDDIQTLREGIFPDGVNINRAVVGKLPEEVGRIIGVDVPEGTRLLMYELKKVGKEEPLARETLFPATRFVVYEDYHEACMMVRKNLLENDGAGHSAIVYSTNHDKLVEAGDIIPVGRLIACAGGSAGSGNLYDYGLPPTFAIGCGSWGGNGISENLTFRHLLNITNVTEQIPNVVIPSYEDMWK